MNELIAHIICCYLIYLIILVLIRFITFLVKIRKNINHEIIGDDKCGPAFSCMSPLDGNTCFLVKN